MKRKINFLIGLLLVASGNVFAQTYVNEMLKADVERDCYIEGGGVVYNDASTVFYNDASYVQKADANTPTAFIFNREVWNDKNLTGFIVNMLVPNDIASPDDFIKIEYSLDEKTYNDIPDMKVENSYDPGEGGNYWIDVWYQAALPAGVKEIKVTLIANPNSANWIPCFRRAEIFYEGGTPYQYMAPPYIQITPETYSIDFESDNFLMDMGGSQNSTSTIEVVDNPFKSGINTSDKVLKIVQDPSSDDWGWGNADWFGVELSVKDGEGKQLTKITNKGRYLNFMVYRPEGSVFGMETWGGNCTYKQQDLPFTGSENWQIVTIDLNEFIGKTFSSFYFSPNELFGTNQVSVPETTYFDNIYISDVGSVNKVEGSISDISIKGKSGCIEINGAEGEALNIFTPAGALVHGGKIQNNTEEIQVNSGIYIVKAGSKASKVIVY